MDQNTQALIDGHAELCKQCRPKWGEGPWQSEPDRLEFQSHGFNCLLSRNSMLGNWCGYVGLPKTHSLYGRERPDILDTLDVYGGVTYSAHCDGFICHVTQEKDELFWVGFACHVTQEKDELFWVGFDCGHSQDVIPALVATMKTLPRAPWPVTYKTLVWVKKETERLALQLASK
jgi:hypothetical protein